MQLLFSLLLVVSAGRCTDDLRLEMKTVRVGEDVNLPCVRKGSGSLFWIRLVSGAFPQVIRKPNGYGIDDFRIQTSRDPGNFNLHISKAKLSDSAVYICLKTLQHDFMFLNGVDLRVEALEPDATAVTSPDPINSTNSQTSQTEENSVCCFRARSHQPHLSFTCSEGNTFGECDKNLDGQSAKKCVVGFYKNISNSDVGSYYCATCEETDSVNRSELNSEVSALNTTGIFVLSAALAVSLFVVAFLIYSVKKLQNKPCDCCKASVVLQTITSGNQENQQTDENSLVYSTPVFTSRKSRKAERREAKPSKEESIYTDVSALGLD